MRTSELVSLAYFLGLVLIGLIRPLPPDRRLQIAAIGVASAAGVFAIGHHAPAAVRDWAPAIAILIGYYLSGRFFVRPSPWFERWLIASERRLLGDPATRFAAWPRPLIVYLELAYFSCFLLVPAGFAVLAAAGRSSLADRYWTMVVAAEFAAFAPLSLVQSRPPWLIERPVVLSNPAIHGAGVRWVEAFTIRANTFPSGHVAGSLAVAFALADAMPAAAAIFLLVSLSISVACVVGRYHYVVDVIAGAVVALVIWGVVSFGDFHG